MKIIQVCPYFYPHVGGVESHVLSLSKAMIRKGHDVIVYTSRYDKDLKENDNVEGVPVFRVKTPVNIFTVPFMPKLKKLLLKESADIIHAHTPPPFTEYYTSRACKRSGVPLIITYHCDPEVQNILNTPVTGLYRRTLGYYALVHTRKIIVHTKTYAGTSRALWRFDPVIIPSAIDITRFHPKNDGDIVRKKHNLENKKVILYVGRFKYHKGLDHLIEAASLLDSNTYFILVGTGDFKPTMQRLIAKYGLQDRFILTGHVPRDILPNYYAAADIFVLPSVMRLEAFGLVIVEAMATGKPVVISDIPGVREVISDKVHGFLAEPANPHDLASKIKRLLDDPGLGEKLGRSGRKKVEESFNWDHVVKHMIDLYEGVVVK